MAKSLKAVKNMDSKVWSELKSEAAKHNAPMADFLELLIEEHKKRERKKDELERLVEFVKKHAPMLTEETAQLKEVLYKHRDRSLG